MTAEARRPLLWWDIAVVGMLMFQAVFAVFEATDGSPGWAVDQPLAARLALLALPLLAFVVLYLTLGRRALLRGMRDEPLGVAGAAWLALLVLVVAFAAFTLPVYAILQALAYPVVWTVSVRYRDAVLWSAATALAVGGGLYFGISAGDGDGALASAGITAPISFLFAVVMGTWISRIFEQGETYRQLLESLRASQSEVAALSEAAGAASERERLSRELHDTLTQTLTGLVMLSEQAERALAAGDAERAADRLARVSAASREAMTEARALVATTQPLADGGLALSIERVAARLREDAGLRVSCDLEALALDRELEVVLLRATQEGLANARRHARASAVSVSLRERPLGSVLLRVEDDGIGPGEAQTAGFGLSGLADRVRAAGGEVSFGPGAVRGAVLEVRLPIDASAGRGLEAEQDG